MGAGGRISATGEVPDRGPLVSVVIPFFDPPDGFLREAVDSVLAQGYRPLELCLVNDGSSRETVYEAQRVIADASVSARYLEHPGGRRLGTSATRNLGAQFADGEFIAFLDADDTWAPDKIAQQVEVMQRDPHLALVFGLTCYWYSWLDPSPGRPRDFVPDRGLRRAVTFRPPGFVARFLRGRLIVPSASNVMIRRSAFFDCGGFEDSFHDMYDDQACWVKLALTRPVAGVPVCWDRYRQHSGSMTARAREARAEVRSRRVFLRWVRDYCRDRGVDAPEVREAVEKELWLLGPAAATPGRDRSFVRWCKKSWLRVEECVVPARWRHRVWAHVTRQCRES